MKTVRVAIEGWVQGVAYRAWTQRQAQELGLAGWVRNRREGWVEALFSGGEGAVDGMLAACANGPAAARVSAVRILGEGEPAPADPVFRVRPSK